MSRPWRITLGCFVVIILMIAGFRWYGQASKTEELPVVRIGYTNTLGALSMFVARDEHLFEARGLKPEFIPFQSSNQLTEALIRGDADLTTFNGMLTLLNAEAIDPDQAKVFSVSDISQEHPFDALIVKKDSTIQSSKDLEGKKIGTFPGSTATSILKRYFNEQRVDSSAITFVPMAPQTQLAALESGSIDALYTYEPNMALAIQEQGARKISGSIFDALYPHSPLATGMISNTFIQAKPELAKRAVAAVDEANRFTQANEARAREVAKAQFNLSPKVVSAVSIVPMSESSKLHLARTNGFIDFLISIGELKVRPNTENFFYQP